MANPPSRRNKYDARLTLSALGVVRDHNYQRAGTVLGTEARNEWGQQEDSRMADNWGRVMHGDKVWENALAQKGPSSRKHSPSEQSALVKALRKMTR